MASEHPPGHMDWHRAEERFRLMVESVKDYAIFMLEPNGVVATWNEGAHRIKGYAPEEIIGSHFSRFYPPEDIAARKPEKELEIALADGRVEDEGWRVRKDGTRFWANVVITALHDPGTGELRGFGKVTRDLTERRRAEEGLRHSEEQFRLLIEEVSEYAIFMLDVGGHVATWNAGARRIKGYTAEEIIGRHFGCFYTPEDQAAGKPGRLLAHARDHGSARDQGVRVRKDGTRFQVDALITAIHDTTGELRGYSKVTRDITDQVRAREIETAKRAAERANQAKDEFLAVLSHELRTPLTPVLAALDFLRDNAAALPPAEWQDTLALARRNVLLEAQLIDDLLDITRISRGKIELQFEAVDLHDALEDSLRICQPDAMTKRLTFQRNFSAESHWVWADTTRIRQVFWNLINNAVKFTPAGGAITVSSRNPAPGRLEVTVADTGMGVPPELAVRIFEAFEQGQRTVTRAHGGLGLGLAITRSLVAMHHGTIELQSDGLGKGAAFTVSLATVPEAPVTTVASALPPSGGVRILLVDDHPDTARILSRLLCKRGYHVAVAGSIAAAVAILADPFEILISDIGLPDGTGHELLQKAKALHPQIQGIALSGFGMEEDVERSRDAGFVCHLTKPADIEAIQECIGSIMAKSADAARRHRAAE